MLPVQHTLVQTLMIAGIVSRAYHSVVTHRRDTYQSWDPDLTSNNDVMPPQSTNLSSKYRLLTLPHAFLTLLQPYLTPIPLSWNTGSYLWFKLSYIPSLRPLYLYSAAHELAKEQRKNFGEDITYAIRYAKKKVFMSSIIYLVICGILVC